MGAGKHKISATESVGETVVLSYVPVGMKTFNFAKTRLT